MKNNETLIPTFDKIPVFLIETQDFSIYKKNFIFQQCVSSTDVKLILNINTW